MDIRTVALLRGINVGNSKRVAMAALRDLLSGLGYTNVSTLLNSGNAVFDCSPTAARTAASDIAEGVRRELGVDCRVVVRTAAELRVALDQAPMLDRMTDESRYFVGFLDAAPSASGRRAVAETDVEPDRVELVGREVYLWCPGGLLASPLGKMNWDRTLGCAVTMRNFKTTSRIAALL